MIPVYKDKNELGQYVALVLDKAIYSDRAIMKTCYVFTDRYYIHVTSLSAEQYQIYFYSKAEIAKNTQMESLPIQHFLEELNDNQLRQILLAETQVVHEEIVRKAFSPAAQLASREYAQDALSIMVSAG
ncbi:hypothetical protein M979_1079 [Buttiauxella noackiae ATCC 51607]|uniref:His-Xaa-Ser system protein HxsD n=1 Tax=Buttiauxella noackiae ATCC 51607 TaxID=1354255 RepID=A0A1B7HVP8_9ENTR|nr:His-Xaa-Ser system protein HxsD [Buttiauxella noackiae]OAT19767.1 hypothetical protein M979_1079 [Buttiauxella noackiae ATCC 51607]